jgi:hypothetical protein
VKLGLPAARRSAALRPLLGRIAEAIGPVGLVAVAVMATCIGYYAGSIAPLRDEISALHEARDLAARRSSTAAPAGPRADRVAEFAAFFPAEDSAGRWLGRIYEIAAREGLRLQQGEYRMSDADALDMRQYRVTLPVRGSYVQIRRFVGRVLEEVPPAALSQLSFQREHIGTPGLEARIELTLHLRARRVASSAGQPTATQSVARSVAEAGP